LDYPLYMASLSAATPPTRADGRLASQIRPPVVEEGLLHRADGSARLTVGHTVVLAATFGPGASRGARPGDRPELLSIEVVFGGSGGGSASAGVPAEKMASYRARLLEVLRCAVRLEAYPRCGLVVALRVLRDDGGVFAALVNVACAALMDAGVEMHCLPVGCAFAWARHSDGGEACAHGDMIVDPDSAEEAKHSIVTVVCGAGLKGSTLAVIASGPIGDSALAQCASAAEAAALTYAEISRRRV